MGKQETSRVFDFYPLEDRILLSGEGLEGAELAPDVDPELTASLMAEMAADGQATNQVPSDQTEPNSPTDSSDAIDPKIFDPALPLEVVFIDAGVEDAQTLLDGLRGEGEDQSQWLIVELNADEDGIEQITQTLSRLSDVDAVHIVSHGDGQGLQLGNTRLDVDTAAGYAGDLTSWGDALDSDADLLIYGCDLASTENGRALVESLGALCDCDVAASDDATGHEELGGDWDLEFSTGDIGTSIAFSTPHLRGWHHTLDISSNLVLHLDLDETTGTTVSDSSGNGNHGNLVGTTSFVSGQLDGGIGVNYTDGEDYIEIANSATLEDVQEGNYTLSVWFHPDSTPPGTGADNDALYGILIKQGWHNGLYYGADNRFHFDHVLTGDASIGVSTANTFAPGQFYHVSGVVDRTAGTVSIYVDGQHQGTSNFTPGTAAREFGTETWKLGIANPGASNWGWAADGVIDEARIYDRALSATDVQELYDDGFRIDVDTTNDAVDGTTTDVATLLANKGADGFISLREAILAVNNDSGTNWTINLGAGTYNITSGGSDSTGDFDIRNDVVIVGDGIGSTIIDANSVDRVFQVHSSTVTLKGMTIQEGGGASAGGALYTDSASDVTINQVMFFDNNPSLSDGGAIRNASTLTITDSVFESNVASNSRGGAIYQTSGGNTTITNSLFVNNSATLSNGGAIYASGAFEITNTTFSGNSVGLLDHGSAIYVNNGTTTLQNVTVTAGSSHDLGAVRLSASATLNIGNTIIAGNTGSTHDDLSANASATINDLGNNLIGDGTGQSDLADGVNGNQVGSTGSEIDPMLGVLSDNGGPTWTHALLVGSTAIDAGNLTGAPAADQRGTSRDANPDIGAYEYVAGSTPQTFTVTNTNNSGAGSLRQAIIDANANAGADVIDFNIAGSGTQVIDLSSQLDITDQVTIDGTTQTGWTEGSFLPIVIDGGSSGINGLNFTSTADGSEIRGLVIRDFTFVAVEIADEADNITVAGNWIGQFNSDGSDDGDGEQSWIGIRSRGDNVVIGGTTVADRNVFSGDDYGVIVRGTSTGTTVSGNYFGTAIDGDSVLGDSLYGILLQDDVSGNTIGGATSAHANVFVGSSRPHDLCHR